MKEYFSHDYSARNDCKITKLVMKHGMEGIGVFWCIVEMLYEEGGYLPIIEYERITFELRTKYNLVKSIIEDFNLFTIKDGLFYSDSILTRLEKRAEKSEKARKSVNKRWSKYKKNTNVLPPYNECNTIKENKIKEKNITKKEIIYPFFSKEFKHQWREWKKYKLQEHKFKFKSEISENKALVELKNLSNGNEQTAIEIINRSIAQGWKGLFALDPKQKNRWNKKEVIQDPVTEINYYLNQKDGKYYHKDGTEYLWS